MPPQSQSVIPIGDTQGVLSKGHVQTPAGVLQTATGVPGV